MEKQILNILTELNKWVVLILPIITFLTLVIPKIRKKLKNILQKFMGLEDIKQELEAGFSGVSDLQKQIEEIRLALQCHIDKDEEKMKAQMSNLKDSLMRAFHFYEDRGYISLEELTTLQELYDSYRSFGGNGVIKKKWETEILQLPDKPFKDK